MLSPELREKWLEGFFMVLRTCMVSCFVFVSVSVASAETIKVGSPGPDFFENVVLDSLLLMDRRATTGYGH